ncbi:MAG: hypothetical protein KAY08_03170 [Giesbergeria sp.]|nr:hypothetical protein [Giesbergeria sp.]
MTQTTASPFTDLAAVARYAEGPRRNVPGYDSLLRMSRILLAECVPADGRVLVVGAGGGLELEDMALAQPGWRFDGVDPPSSTLATRFAATSTCLGHMNQPLASARQVVF